MTQQLVYNKAHLVWGPISNNGGSSIACTFPNVNYIVKSMTKWLMDFKGLDNEAMNGDDAVWQSISCVIEACFVLNNNVLLPKLLF